MQVSRVEVPDVGHKPLTPHEEASYFEIPLNCGLPCQGWSFWQDHVSASPTHIDVAPLSFVVEEVFN